MYFSWREGEGRGIPIDGSLSKTMYLVELYGITNCTTHLPHTHFSKYLFIKLRTVRDFPFVDLKSLLCLIMPRPCDVELTS